MISTNFDVNLYLMQPRTNHPPTLSIYLIFNQLRIIHPQFRPKSRTSVLEPPQNILSNAFSYLELTIAIEYSIVVVRARSKEEAICRRGPHKLWLKRATIRLLRKTLTRVTAGTRVGVSGASLSPTEDCVLIFEISRDRHDRSCLEMSEADGVDGGAFRQRGLTHLQWAEKPEAPEAERHLGTRISRVSVSPWVRECSNLLAVGPGSEILPLDENLMGRNFKLYIAVQGMSPFFRTRMIGKTLTRVTAGTRVGVSGASLSPTEDCVLIFEISRDRHDRSCLEMSEADGVDGGAFRQRGLTHLQWAEKPEAPEAERHLGTRIVE
ncbi:LOW QUALITY PROTEIN: hypothetical protein V1478_012241 [Vespula squamosa]|uniref:Uncharacterized protein n=1 Tax=Vespula squamosa TaxID=30214 RepID=A0ABD2ACV3_VESSQ